MGRQSSWKRLARRHPGVAKAYATIATYHTSKQAFWVAEPEQSARKTRQLAAFVAAARMLGYSAPR
ncbi:MAG: hypothetical protein KY447_08035 [Actinobacteria bacterium]|nr:hypothetical protein [Actinomycetota bacterium]